MAKLYAYDFLTRMQRAQDKASIRRARGEHTGASAKGWGPRKYAPRDRNAPETLEEWLIAWRLKWRDSCVDVIEDYRMATFGTVIDDWRDFR